jgi:hypothetical protein
MWPVSSLPLAANVDVWRCTWFVPEAPLSYGAVWSGYTLRVLCVMLQACHTDSASLPVNDEDTM